MKKERTVYVALSGGVDSSVSAALLQREGFHVVCVFIKVWQPDFVACVSRDDRRDAMRVAAHIGIPLKTLDLSKEYKRDVVDYMIAEYKAGRTPNPDVMCNKKVKFGAFFDFAMKEGADYVATGHYARVRKGRAGYELLAGKDPSKDQSYFLWTLTRRELQKTLFPVGHMEKSEVRRCAKKFGLHTAEKKDSQGLCFMGKVDMPMFLRHYIPQKKGDVLNERGETVGVHEGAHFLTLGQRHGFSVSAKSPREAPLYVVAKNIRKNTVTVSPRATGEGPAVLSFPLKCVHWIGGRAPRGRIFARTRYRQGLLPARFIKKKGRKAVCFQKPLLASHGQSVVFYRGATCLGGGVLA